MLGQEGIGCIPFSPLAQGMLTNRYLGGVAAGSRASKPHGFLKAAQITDDKLAKVRALGEIALMRNQSLAQMALAWVLRDGRVTSALIGASSVTQLEECVGATANLAFDADELKQIDSILA